MIKRTETKYGITVESAVLSEKGETERARLNDLAMQEYEDTGALSSERLLEAGEDFLNKAKQKAFDETMDAQTID